MVSTVIVVLEEKRATPAQTFNFGTLAWGRPFVVAVYQLDFHFGSCYFYYTPL